MHDLHLMTRYFSPNAHSIDKVARNSTYSCDLLNNNDCAHVTRYALFPSLGRLLLAGASRRMSFWYSLSFPRSDSEFWIALALTASTQHQVYRTRTQLNPSQLQPTSPTMPGFTSHLLARTPFTLRPSSPPPPSDSDSESEIVRAAMRRAQKSQNAKVTTLYDTTMTRPTVERSYQAMKRLQATLTEQAERLHDAGLAKPKERKAMLEEFAVANREVLRDGGALLRMVKVHGGPVGDLAEGLRILGCVMGEAEEKMGLEDAEKVMGVYGREIGEPLGEMGRKFGAVLGDRRAWRKKDSERL